MKFVPVTAAIANREKIVKVWSVVRAAAAVVAVVVAAARMEVAAVVVVTWWWCWSVPQPFTSLLQQFYFTSS